MTESTLLQRVKMQAVFWLARRLPNCKELAPLMSQALDRRLSIRERIALKLHLMICEWCRRYARQLRLMRETLSHVANADDVESSTTLSPEARERIKRSLSGGNS